MLRKARRLRVSTCPSGRVSWRWCWEILSSPVTKSRSLCLHAFALGPPRVTTHRIHWGTRRGLKRETQPTSRSSSSKGECLSKNRAWISDAHRQSAKNQTRCLTVRIDRGIILCSQEVTIILRRVERREPQLKAVSGTVTLLFHRIPTNRTVTSTMLKRTFSTISKRIRWT